MQILNVFQFIVLFMSVNAPIMTLPTMRFLQYDAGANLVSKHGRDGTIRLTKLSHAVVFPLVREFTLNVCVPIDGTGGGR